MRFDHQARSKRAPRTVEKIHLVLHRALKMAVRWGYLPRNPADTEAVDKPRAARHDIRPPEPAELARLIDTAQAAGDRLAGSGPSGSTRGRARASCWGCPGRMWTSIARR